MISHKRNFNHTKSDRCLIVSKSKFNQVLNKQIYIHQGKKKKIIQYSKTLILPILSVLKGGVIGPKDYWQCVLQTTQWCLILTKCLQLRHKNYKA